MYEDTDHALADLDERFLDCPFGRPAAQHPIDTPISGGLFTRLGVHGGLRRNTEDHARAALITMKGYPVIDHATDDCALALVMQMTPDLTRKLVKRYLSSGAEYPTEAALTELLGAMENEGVLFGG